MRQTELRYLLKTTHKEIKKFIAIAGESVPSISKKINLSDVDFNTEESVAIAKAAGANPLIIIYIEENCKKNVDGYKIKGTEDFLKRWNEKNDIKCCNTCDALCGVKRGSDSVFTPFCKVYNRFLSNMKAKVYEDYCSSWIYNGFEKPRVWLKQSAPSNLNQYGEAGYVNGIDEKQFRDRKQTESIDIIGEIGF